MRPPTYLERVGITVILVLGVIAVVLWTLAGKTGGTAAQFAAPISGLTGICLGWLFTRDDGRSVLLADATARAGRPRAQSGRQPDEAAPGEEPISGTEGPPAAQDGLGTDA